MFPHVSEPKEGVPWSIIAPRVVGDLVAVFSAFALNTAVYALAVASASSRSIASRPGVRYLGLATLFAAITVLVFWRLSLYERRASVLNLWELDRSVKAITIAAAFFLATLFVFKLEGFSRLVVVGSLATSMVLVTGVRRIIATWFRSRRAKRGGGRRVLIVGCGDMGRLLMKKIVDAPHLHREVSGFRGRKPAPRYRDPVRHESGVESDRGSVTWWVGASISSTSFGIWTSARSSPTAR